MTNHGYNGKNKNWSEANKGELAHELSIELKIPIGKPDYAFIPYIEIDGEHGGVRIRRLTYLTPEAIEKIVKRADQIYSIVMK